MKTILGIDRETKLEISVKDKERRKGVYLLGATGQGKSSLLAYMILQDLQKDYAVIVLDPHGDLLNYVIALMPETRLKKTYLLDMTDSDFPFGLNLFTCPDPTNVIEQAKAVDRVMHIFARHWPETRGILLEKLLRYISLTFLQHPGYSLVDVPRLLWDDAFRSGVVSTLSNEQVKAYWQREYGAMSLAERRRDIQALDNRLAAFNTTTIVRNIVGQRRNTIDIRRAIEEREVLLIRLPMEQMRDSAALIGTILLAQIHAATFAFGELDWDQRPGFSLYVDEFQDFATSDFSILLREGRKYGLRIVVAHQDRRELPPEIRAASLTASTIGCFRPTPEDAVEMTPLLYDATVTQRPEHIFPDVLHRLRLHGRREIQEFYRGYVQPLQQQDRPRTDRQRILTLLQDLLYHAVKSQIVDEDLLETYFQSMYPIINLTFHSAQQKQKQIQAELQQREQVIAELTAFLANDRAFERYIIRYYNYYRPYSQKHALDWYYQPWVPEDVVLTDAGFWRHVLGEETHIYWETRLPNEIIASLQAEAMANDALCLRNTPEKLLSDEKARLAAAEKQRFQAIWQGIAKIYEIKYKYATPYPIREIYFKAYQDCMATPIESKPEPYYLHVTSKRGFVLAKDRVKDFEVKSLPLKSATGVADWLPNSGYISDYYYSPPEGSLEEARRARSTVMEIWSKIKYDAQEIHNIRSLLLDEAAILKAYYTRIGKTMAGHAAWEHINNEQVDDNIWDALRKEAWRNAILSEQMNTFEKILEVRRNQLHKKIALLTQELNAYKATIPRKHAQIRKEMDDIDERRTAFCTYVREIIEILILDPDVLAERRTLKESDVRVQLLDLSPRQAYVRVGSSATRRPQKCIVQIPDLPGGCRKTRHNVVKT